MCPLSPDVDRNILSRRARPNWWIVVPLVWAVLATIAMLHALVMPAMYSPRGVGHRDWIMAAVQFSRYMLWAPLTPLIVAAVRRFPFQRPGLARSIAVHACIALLSIAFVEALSTQIQSQLFRAVTDSRGMSGRVILATTVTSRLLIGLVTYSAVVAIASALDYQRRLRDEAVRVAQLQRDLSDAQYMAREPLKQIEAKLDPARFARAHRSALVNLSRVKALDPLTAGEHIITLTTGTRLTLSRGYRDHFKSRLESAHR